MRRVLLENQDQLRGKSTSAAAERWGCMDIEVVAREIVDAAIVVHTRLGPGMLESAYEACMGLELAKRSLSVRKQVPLPLRYDDRLVDVGYRLDMLVEDAVHMRSGIKRLVNQLAQGTPAIMHSEDVSDLGV